MPLESPNALDKLHGAIDEKNLPLVEKIINGDVFFQAQAFYHAIITECNEVADLVLKNQEYRINKYILVNFHPDYCLKKDGYTRE